MNLLIPLVAAFGLGALAGGIAMVIWLVGHQSHERRGKLELDTPEAREALRDRQ